MKKTVALLVFVFTLSGCSCTKDWLNSVDEDFVLAHAQKLKRQKQLFRLKYGNTLITTQSINRVDRALARREKKYYPPPREHHKNNIFGLIF